MMKYKITLFKHKTKRKKLKWSREQYNEVNFDTVFKTNKYVNENYINILKFLLDNNIEYTLSKQRSAVNRTRSIYIPITKLNGFVHNIRISDHNGTTNWNEIIQEHDIRINYSKVINLKWLKEELTRVGSNIVLNARELRKDPRNADQTISQEYGKVKKELKKLIGKNKYKLETGGSKFGYATLKERIDIIKDIINKYEVNDNNKEEKNNKSYLEKLERDLKDSKDYQMIIKQDDYLLANTKEKIQYLKYIVQNLRKDV